MSNPLELVRVKDPTGAEYAASRQHAKSAGMTVLPKDVRDKYGRMIPAKSDPLRASTEPKKKPAAKPAETQES